MTRLSIHVALALVPLGLVATAGLAQQQNPQVYLPPVIERRQTEMTRQQTMTQTDILRERLGGRAGKTTSMVYVHALISQVKQDFEGVQVARNQIVRAVHGNNGLDYKLISEVTGEITRRSSRLKNNLALPTPEKEKTSQKELLLADEKQVRQALITLCNHIEAFVTSPFFETPGVIDVNDSAKASLDLDSMVELSSSIKKSIQRLNKTPH